MSAPGSEQEDSQKEPQKESSVSAPSDENAAGLSKLMRSIRSGYLCDVIRHGSI